MFNLRPAGERGHANISQVLEGSVLINFRARHGSWPRPYAKPTCWPSRFGDRAFYRLPPWQAANPLSPRCRNQPEVLSGWAPSCSSPPSWLPSGSSASCRASANPRNTVMALPSPAPRRLCSTPGTSRPCAAMPPMPARPPLRACAPNCAPSGRRTRNSASSN